MQSPLVLVRRVAVFAIMLVVAAARAASADSLMLAWDPSTDSTVSGYVVYVGVQSSVYTQTFDVGNTTTFVYSSAVAGQRYYFAVAAYAPGPLFSAKSAEITGVSNSAPLVTNPGTQTTSVGQSVTLQIGASDPDGTPLTFSASGLPSGLMLTSTTGAITGAPTTAGTYTVTVTASDGVLRTSVTFTWTVSGQGATAPTLVSPTGTITTNTPRFVWNAGNSAVAYLLVVDDSITSGKIRTTVSPSSAGCATTTICSFSPGVPLAPGAARWVVETLTSTGDGPWSAPMAFSMADTVAPSVAIISPVRSGTTYETMHGSLAVSGTAADNVAVAAVSWVNSLGNSGTATGTASWSTQVALRPGINVITVTARDSSGNTSSSSITAVGVAPPTPVSPVSTITSSTPTFVWNAVPAASKYVLQVIDSTSAVKALITVTPFEAGCESTTPCRFQPAVTLAAGTARWSVETIAMSDLGAWSASPQFTVGTSAPTIAITSPTQSSSYSTSSTAITLSGVASDTVGITTVTWIDSRGRSGVASGTSTWSTGSIPLTHGKTTFYVTATNTAGNKATASLTVQQR